MVRRAVLFFAALVFAAVGAVSQASVAAASVDIRLGKSWTWGESARADGWDSGRSDSISATWYTAHDSVPETLQLSASRGGDYHLIEIRDTDDLVVGDNPLSLIRDWDLSLFAFEQQTGRLVVSAIERGAGGEVVSLVADWTLVNGSGQRVSGSLRFGSPEPLSAVGLTDGKVAAGPTEVGSRSTVDVTLINRGDVPLQPVGTSVGGVGAADWSVEPTSPCLSAATPVGESCALTVVFAPVALASDAEPRRGLLSILPAGWAGGIDVPLTGRAIGQPSPLTSVRVDSTAFGVVLGWELPTYGGGAPADHVTITKSMDGGATWREVGVARHDPLAPYRTDLYAHRFSDLSGLAPGRTARYRLTQTNAFAVPGQTTVYTSDPAEVSVTGAYESIVTDAMHHYEGGEYYRVGAQGLDGGEPGFFLPETATRVMSASPTGREVVMAFLGGPAATPNEIRRFPANGSFDLSRTTVLTRRTGLVDQLAWSPDGSRLAWTEYEAAVGSSRLHLARLTSTGLTEIRALDILGLKSMEWLGDSASLVGTFGNSPIRVNAATGTWTWWAQVTDGWFFSSQSLSPARDLLLAAQGDGRGNERLAMYPVAANGTLGPLSAKFDFDVYTRPVITGFGEPRGDGRHVFMTPRGYGYVTATATSVSAPDYRTNRYTNNFGSALDFRPGLNVSSATRPVASIEVGAMAPGVKLECRLDAQTFAPCSAPSWTAPATTSGPHRVTVRATEPSGRVAYTARVVTVDSTAPAAPTVTVPAIAIDETVPVRWAAAERGLASHDVRMRYAAPGAPFSAWLQPAGWQGIRSTILTPAVGQGLRYCFSVRSRDGAGNIGAWSAERCVDSALDDRSLASSGGWVAGTSAAYGRGTYKRSTGTVALIRSVRARQVAVVGTTCPTCGSVDVYVGAVRLGRVSFTASTAAVRQVRWLPLQSSLRTGTLTIRPVSSASVWLDAVVVRG